jgi:hypothetical protein
LLLKNENHSISQEKKLKIMKSIQGLCVWLIRGVSLPKQNWENHGSRYVGVLVTNLTTAEKIDEVTNPPTLREKMALVTGVDHLW